MDEHDCAMMANQASLRSCARLPLREDEDRTES